MRTDGRTEFTKLIAGFAVLRMCLKPPRHVNLKINICMLDCERLFPNISISLQTEFAAVSHLVEAHILKVGLTRNREMFRTFLLEIRRPNLM
jgi:hypothetical protein